MDERARRGKGNPNGNPGSFKFTPLKQDIYLGCLRSGMRRGEAARRAGVCRLTVSKYAKAHPEFLALEEQAEVDACDIVEDHMLKAIEKGNATLIMFWLQNRAPDRWMDRRVPVNVVQNAAPKDLEDLQKQLLKKLETIPDDSIKG